MKCLVRIVLFTIGVFCFGSCEKYLDVKPDKKQVIPISLEDCQALLNNVSLLAYTFPSAVEISSDDYYLLFTDYKTLSPDRREPYLWQSDANVNFGDWSGPYNKILVANQILETLKNINPSSQQKDQWNQIKGSALLLRSMSFYGLAQEFAKPYDIGTASQDLGIPIRLTPSIGEKTERGNLQQTYDRILQDFTEAASLLPGAPPVAPVSKSVAMPVKAAAFAALARVYLTMGNYIQAYENADACLKQYNVLIDYKTINTSPYYTIPRFGQEVIYENISSGFVPIVYGLANPELYNSYETGDLRKNVLFVNYGGGNVYFRGTYGAPGEVFPGFATDEMYLIRAECSARSGNGANAITDLNALLQKRWDNTFIPYTITNAEEVLKIVIAERRKELPFRGLRWIDLRRLNKDSRFAVTLKRTLNGQIYELPPNDLRYTLLIPREILERVSLPQNPR